MMQQEEADSVTTTDAVAQSSPEARPPARNSFRQQRSVAEVAAINVEAVSSEVEKRPGHLHGEAELGYNITVYPRYFRTIVGILKVIEIIVAIIICATVDASQCVTGVLCSSPSSPLWYGVLGGQGFVLFVGVVLILGNCAFIGYHIFKKPTPISELADRIRLGELVYDAAAIVLLITAGSVEAWYASWITLTAPVRTVFDLAVNQIVWNPYRPQWIAAAIFAWINALVYTGDAICLFFFDDDAPRSGTFN